MNIMHPPSLAELAKDAPKHQENQATSLPKADQTTQKITAEVSTIVAGHNFHVATHMAAFCEGGRV